MHCGIFRLSSGSVVAQKKAIQALRLAPSLGPVRLRSGQRVGVCDAGCFPGLRPKLVYVGLLALGG